MDLEQNGDRDVLLTVKEYAAIFRVTQSAVSALSIPKAMA